MCTDCHMNGLVIYIPQRNTSFKCSFEIRPKHQQPLYIKVIFKNITNPTIPLSACMKGFLIFLDPCTVLFQSSERGKLRFLDFTKNPFPEVVLCLPLRGLFEELGRGNVRLEH